jgi:hypothetical protein
MSGADLYEISMAFGAWLPFVDVYRTKCVVPRHSFRLRLEQVTRLGLAA